MADEFTLTARWVFPVARPPLERGLVTVGRDRVAAVEEHGSRKADVDLGDVAIVPGFVNAHTHLDLTGARGLTPPTLDFVDWLRQVIAYRRQRTLEQVGDDIRSGIGESFFHGTTLIGDIAAGGKSWHVLKVSPVRSVVFREMLGLPQKRAQQAWWDMLRWQQDLEPSDTCRPGLSPHAPYSVNISVIRAAARTGLPVAIHVAESLAEMELLEQRSGPLVAFLNELGVWEESGLARGITEVLRRTRRATSMLYVHGNYLSGEADIPEHATIVYCPRTHAAFGHPPHPLRQFVARGVRVALGTDSLASNPDLSVLAEARFIRSRYPGFPGNTLLRLATLNGAQALGWADESGSLEPGKSADFAVVALPDRDKADPHHLLFESDLPVVATWFRGREVYRATG